MTLVSALLVVVLLLRLVNSTISVGKVLLAEHETVSYIWLGGVSEDSRAAKGALEARGTELESVLANGGIPISPGTTVLEVSKTSLWASNSRNQLSSSSSRGCRFDEVAVVAVALRPKDRKLKIN